MDSELTIVFEPAEEGGFTAFIPEVPLELTPFHRPPPQWPSSMSPGGRAHPV
ncbi:MAG: hypothetical protein KJZ62_08925 [Fimbriimonadaceae bacterium]|nr:hypothetical protein [Fimbriimonadaceae bacterium]